MSAEKQPYLMLVMIELEDEKDESGVIAAVENCLDSLDGIASYTFGEASL